uniref:Uncharacterized protein n=1 Tax=Palpitomonas bilix TaxID=652834 RepID=A0A7S3DBU8_9EUKA
MSSTYSTDIAGMPSEREEESDTTTILLQKERAMRASSFDQSNFCIFSPVSTSPPSPPISFLLPIFLSSPFFLLFSSLLYSYYCSTAALQHLSFVFCIGIFHRPSAISAWIRGGGWWCLANARQFPLSPALRSFSYHFERQQTADSGQRGSTAAQFFFFSGKYAGRRQSSEVRGKCLGVNFERSKCDS